MDSACQVEGIENLSYGGSQTNLKLFATGLHHYSLPGRLYGHQRDLPSTILHSQKAPILDFPGALMVKNSPANAEDTGSIPVPGRSHMPEGN